MSNIDTSWYSDIDAFEKKTKKKIHAVLNTPIPPANSDGIEDKSNILDDPRTIADYLKFKTFAQDEACEQVAQLVWLHTHGHPHQHMCMIGGTGTGKTHVWNALSGIDERLKVVIIDSSAISPTGFTGPSFQTLLYNNLWEDTQDIIIVLDEFDKTVCKANSIRDRTWGTSLQGELLNFTSSDYSIRIPPPTSTSGGSKKLHLGTISWVILGAFSDMAEDISERNRTTGLGFNSVASFEEPYSKPYSLDDLVKFGLIRELAGRFSWLVNLNRLNSDNYYTMLTTEYESNPLTQLEKEYNLPTGFIRNTLIADDELHSIAQECSEKGIGVRGLHEIGLRKVREYIFTHYDEYNSLYLSSEERTLIC